MLLYHGPGTPALAGRALHAERSGASWAAALAEEAHRPSRARRRTTARCGAPPRNGECHSALTRPCLCRSSPCRSCRRSRRQPRCSRRLVRSLGRACRWRPSSAQSPTAPCCKLIAGPDPIPSLAGSQLPGAGPETGGKPWDPLGLADMCPYGSMNYEWMRTAEVRAAASACLAAPLCA